MPGSLTTPGRMGTRAIVLMRVAFHNCNSVSTRNQKSYAAQWLAYALPCRRFACTLAGTCARLGADAVRYSFTVVDSHHLLLAGLTGALQSFLYVPAHRFVRLTGSSHPHTLMRVGQPRLLRPRISRLVTCPVQRLC